MADSSDYGGSPASRNLHPSNHTSGTAPRQRARKNKQNAQLDGSVSGSNVAGSPRSKPNAHHRQNTQPTHINKGGYHEQRQRPPSMGSQLSPATPAKEQAYAGPTFQASPAASALPVPKFFSRSVPGNTPLQDRLDADQSPEPQRSSPPSDTAAPVPPPQKREESPLDMFFLADKAEKERSRSGAHSLSPEQAIRPRPAMPPSQNSHSHDGQTQHFNSPGNRPPMPQRFPSSDQALMQQQHTNTQRDAYTKSLKDLLFNNAPAPQGQPPQTQPRLPSQAQQNLHTPSPVHRATSGPSSPAGTPDQHANYNLHYGNRNLSQLFQAARDETPPRPSSLRQEVKHDYPTQPHPNARDFSRGYLNQHIHGGPYPHVPQQPAYPNGVSSRPAGPYNQPSHPYPHPPASAPPAGSAPPSSSIQHGVSGGNSLGNESTTPRATGGGGGSSSGGPDIRTMEDDLRRMLKLNAVS